jgi:hypothetical protein
MRKRATVLLNEEDLYYLLSLEPGERMVSAWPAPSINGVVIGIEGDETTGIPEVSPGLEAPRIDRPYAIVKLRERLFHISAEMHRNHPGDRDAYLRAVGEAVEREIFPQRFVPPAPTVP